MATAHAIKHDKLSAAFRVREWWALLRVNALGYFITWVIVTGLLGILYFVSMLLYSTILLCLFIPLIIAPGSFYVGLVGAALFGQTYRESVDLLEMNGETT